MFDQCGKPRAARYGRQAIEAELVPELVERPDIAQG